ncbi:MAG: SdrD B-like domain-containing protein [Proteocatella sp.]
MRKTTRRRKVFSILTMVMFLVSTAFTSFVYADSISDTDPVAQTIIQQDADSVEQADADSVEQADADSVEQADADSVEQADADSTFKPEADISKSILGASELGSSFIKDDKCTIKTDKIITVTKVWKDENGKIATGIKNLPKVKVKITFEDGKKSIFELKRQDWTETKTIKAGEIVDVMEYSIKSKDLPKGYELLGEPKIERSNSETMRHNNNDKDVYNYTVTNTIVKIPVKLDKKITVTKVWKDEKGNVVTEMPNLPEVKVKITFEDGKKSIFELKRKDWTETKTIKAGEIASIVEYPIKSEDLPTGYKILGDPKIDVTCDSSDDQQTTRCNDDDNDKIVCSYTVTNTIVEIPEEGNKDITVTKVWKEGETVIEDTTDFPEVKVTIDFTDEEIADIELMLNDSNGWTQTAENVDAKLEYIVTEEPVTGLPVGYKTVGEPVITGSCIPAVEDSILNDSDIDNDIKCSYTVVNTVEEKVAVDINGVISGLKYNDLDKDGYHDPEEAVVAGFTINLYDVNPELTEAQPIATAVTDAYGLFSFKVTTAGTYYLREVLVDGWTQSAPANNIFMVTLTAKNYDFPESFTADEAYQSIIQQYAKDETGQLFNVAFIFGNYEKTIDGTSTVIEGHKFSDLNSNGVWDEVEPGLQGWAITLWKYLGDMDESGTLTAADLQNMGIATTDANGHYEFVGIESGITYYVSEDITQTYWTQTYPVTGPELSGTGRMNQVVQIPEGQRVSGIDFGNYYYKPSSGGGGGSSRTGNGGSSTTTTNVIETFSASDIDMEPEVITLSIPVLSSEEEVVLEQAVMASQEIEDPYANPQTSDAGMASQMQALGLSIAAMFILKRKFRS